MFEPSCGEAGFLIAAAERLARLGATSRTLLHGVEIDAASARSAELLLRLDVCCGSFKGGKNLASVAEPDWRMWLARKTVSHKVMLYPSVWVRYLGGSEFVAAKVKRVGADHFLRLAANHLSNRLQIGGHALRGRKNKGPSLNNRI